MHRIGPDGKWIAFNTYPTIWKIKVDGSDLRLLADEGNNFLPAWNSIGSEIAYSRSITDDFGEAGAWVMDSIGNKKKFIVSVGYPNWLFYDRKIIGLRFWNQIIIYDIDQNKEESEHPLLFNTTVYNFDVSPDYKTLLIFHDGIKVVEKNGSNLRKILPPFLLFKEKKGDQLGFLAKNPSWHPDGKHIVYQHFKITEYWKAPEGAY